MITFNSPNTYLQPDASILFNRYVKVQVGAELSGYNIQYLRRILCTDKPGGIKIGQI